MSVAVAAAMMVSLGACGNSADAAKDGTQSAGASGKVYNIGICQQLEHPALDQATQGFEDVLKEKLGDNVNLISRMHRTSRQMLLQLQIISYLPMWI